MLRLLRPAEAAARRLIIVAARGLVVELAPPRLRAAKPKPILNRSNGFGTGVVIRPGPLPEWARALAPKRSSTLSLPLFDPLKRFGVRRRYVKQRDVPRIRSFDDPRIGFFQPPRAPDPLPPSPDDPLDAGRLHRRLEAMASALDDLPRQAKRLARWQARLETGLSQERASDHPGQSRNLPPPLTPPHKGEGDPSALLSSDPGRLEIGLGAADPPPPCGGPKDGRDAWLAPAGVGVSRIRAGSAAGAPSKPRSQRLSPMRPGRPPGWRRKPDHEVYGVLTELHGLAIWARERADTS